MIDKMKSFYEAEIPALKAKLEQTVGQVNLIRGAILAHEAALKELNTPLKDEAMSLGQLKDTLGADSIEVIEATKK
jgi:hypothetical protein